MNIPESVVSMAIAPKRHGFAYQRFVLQALRRGRRAAPLFVQRYEELLPRPLADVRRELRIESIHDAHPAGIRKMAEGAGIELTAFCAPNQNHVRIWSPLLASW